MINLKAIKSPADVKALPVSELPTLAEELRGVLLQKLSRRGGHVGPNLGFVEATVALHYIFDSPIDKIIYDVSHQSYTHKMLTGRIEGFLDPDDYSIVNGYTNPVESEHDFFTIGHTSTSISLALGLAKARDLRGEKGNIIAVIGDGSLSGGEAFEGLDNAAELGSNFIVVVNDNQMSIAENHGGIYDNLTLLRETDGKTDNNYFRALGFDYIYVADGNDIATLLDTFSKVKDSAKPVVVHINTLKGKGYLPAELHKERFHYSGPFDLASGQPLHPSTGDTYESLTRDYLLGKMKSDPTAVAITSGTPSVIGFAPEYRREAGRQFIDVGIAEEHAVALASGLARGGARPFYGVYSTFLQRAYDQLSQDLAINGNPAVIGVFSGGAEGMNDVTHLGFWDIPMISNIPGIVYLLPTCREEYIAMLDWAMEQSSYPVAIRVPLGSAAPTGKSFPTDYSDLNRFAITRKGEKVAIIGAGNFHHLAEETAELLGSRGVNATVINPRFVSGLDTEMLDSLKTTHSLVVTLEDGSVAGGFGQKVAAFYGDSDMKVKVYGLPEKFLDRYSAAGLLDECRLRPDLLTADIMAAFG